MFSDRRDAGRRLADRLVGLRREDPIVVSLPYGALLVADEIADRLQAPLRLLLVRMIRTASPRAQLLGAISENGALSLDASADVPPHVVEEQVALESVELYRRSSILRRWGPPVTVVRRTVVLVDDGSSQGPVVQAAVAALRAERPGRMVFATPVAGQNMIQRLRPAVDETVVLKLVDEPPFAPDHYKSFEPVGDEAVSQILRERGM